MTQCVSKSLTRSDAVLTPSGPNPDITVEIIDAEPAEDAGHANRPRLRIRNTSGTRATLFSPVFPIDPDSPMEARMKARFDKPGAVRMMLRTRAKPKGDLRSVAPVWLRGVASEWNDDFVYGLTPLEARFGQLRLDVDSELVEIVDAWVGPRVPPEAGPATTSVGHIERR